MSEPQPAQLLNDDRFDLVDDSRDHYEDDHSGLAAWTDDDGRFFAVGSDCVVREYEGDDQRLIDDMARAPRFPRPVQGGALGGEPATAHLDRTVRRLRASDELLLTEPIKAGDGQVFRALMVALPTCLVLWVAFGVLLAWIAGRL